MNPDDFEQHLRRQPLNAPPAHWRDEILGAALEFPARGRGLTTGPSLVKSLRDWLWPRPLAWGALGAAWIAIFALNSAAAPNPAELAQARAGARVAAGLAVLDMSQALELVAEPGAHTAADNPRRVPPDQGCIANQPPQDIV